MSCSSGVADLISGGILLQGSNNTHKNGDGPNVPQASRSSGPYLVKISLTVQHV